MSRQILMTILAVLTFGAAVIAHPPGMAYACSCIQPGPPADALDQSEAVFSGTVAEVVPQANGVLVTFDVNEVWKGPNGPQLTLSTSGSSASCGYDFVQGEEYLVYGFAQEGELATGLCTRTAPLANAVDDLAALGEGAAPNPGVVPPDQQEPAEQPAEQPAQQSDGLPVLPISIGVVALAAITALGIAFSRRRAA